MFVTRIRSMKRSRLYILGTAVFVYASIFSFSGVNRAMEQSSSNNQFKVMRTPDAELAEMKDFDAIEIHGLFDLEIVQEPEFSVQYTPPPGDQQSFRAEVQDQVLKISGFSVYSSTVEGGSEFDRRKAVLIDMEVNVKGNFMTPIEDHTEDRGKVRIGMPRIDVLEASFIPKIVVQGFEQEDLSLTLSHQRVVELRENTLNHLALDGVNVSEISLATTLTQSEELVIHGWGTTIITR